MHSIATEETTENNAPETLPYSLPLELTVTDPEVVAELFAKQEGRERDEYALGALRLGVLALKQARGQIDANTLKREGEHLLGNVQLALSEHRTNLDRTLVGTLKDYFDPKDGRFNERVERLLKKDGELETLLSRKVTAADSEMCRALGALVGKDSPLVRLLSPDESNEFLKALHLAVSKELEGQRTQVLREFSLDNKEGAVPAGRGTDGQERAAPEGLSRTRSTPWSSSSPSTTSSRHCPGCPARSPRPTRRSPST